MSTTRDASTPDLHPAAVGDLVGPVRRIDGRTTCAAVDELFRADPELGCVVTTGSGDRHAAATGLVTRLRFQQQMAGRFGYGRALHGRKPVSELADWDPLVLPAATTLAQAAQRVLERSSAARFAEVLVAGPHGELGQVAVSSLFQALAEQYAAEARTDDLTGLANRAHFLHRLTLACAGAGAAPLSGRGERRVAVLYLDLDGFKAVNDAYGHAVGDRLLACVAQRLRGCFRPHDLVARLGGDEFAVLMTAPATTAPAEPGAQEWQLVVDQAGQRAVAALGQPVRVGALVLAGRVSVGVAVAGGGVDAEALLREADLAMYRAKQAGGARVVQARADTAPAPAEHPVPDQRRLRQALDDAEFTLHYQPITDVRGGELASVEALVRWAHPQRGLLGPGQFLPAVHEAGLGVDLDLFVLRGACAQLVAWSARLGPDAPPFVNVNLSLDSLQAPGLADRVLAVVRASGLAVARLRLELPEAATTEHLRHARDELEELRAAGVRLTLDDLGAGASSLHHLTALRLDGMKIDQRFVAGLLDDERDAAVVAMLVELARALGTAVTAEGVETPEQLAALRALADERPLYVQGYLIARPAPAAALPLPWPRGTLQLHDLVPGAGAGAAAPARRLSASAAG